MKSEGLQATKEDLQKLRELVDRFGLAEVLMGISAVCSQKSTEVYFCDAKSGISDVWMKASEEIDQLSVHLEGVI